MALALLATSALALNISPLTRRGAVVGAGLAASNAALPASALDLLGAKRTKKSNINVLLEAFDGKLTGQAELDWFESHFSPDFTCEFVKVVDVCAPPFSEPVLHHREEF